MINFFLMFLNQKGKKKIPYDRVVTASQCLNQGPQLKTAIILTLA
jgi:hypothetical protein